MESFSRHKDSQRSQNDLRLRNTTMGQTLRLITLSLGVMLFTGVPVHAGPVLISDVIQVINNPQNPSDIQLRGAQTASVAVGQTDQSANTSAGAPTDISGSLLSGVAMNSDPPAGIEVLEGEFEGTICDCGEMWVPGGFAKWPLLFLVGIPFFFSDEEIPPPPGSTPPPGPTPPPPSIPEPASLLLFGSGLAAIGAGLRRRHAKAKLAEKIRNEEGQSS